ncbi:MAG TPA: DMT family transporter [Acidimicrobiia bacterium]
MADPAVPGRTSIARHHWLLLVAVVTVSFGAIFVRLSAASPVTVAFFRALYALPLLLLVRRLAANGPARSGRHRSFAFVAGVVLAANNSAWHYAIELMGAGLATVVGSTHVVFMMGAGWLLLGQRPSGLGLTAAPVVLVGVLLISGVVGEDVAGQDPVLGALVGLAMAILYVVFVLIIRHAGTGGASPVGILLDATGGAAAGALLLAPIDPAFSLTPSWPSHGWLLALAVSAQVIGWLIITYVLPKIEAWESSMMLVLEPALTVLWAFLVFAERFSLSQFAGLVLVIGGVAVVAISRRGPSQVQVVPPVV